MQTLAKTVRKSGTERIVLSFNESTGLYSVAFRICGHLIGDKEVFTDRAEAEAYYQDMVN